MWGLQLVLSETCSAYVGTLVACLRFPSCKFIGQRRGLSLVTGQIHLSRPVSQARKCPVNASTSGRLVTAPFCTHSLKAPFEFMWTTLAIFKIAKYSTALTRFEPSAYDCIADLQMFLVLPTEVSHNWYQVPSDLRRPPKSTPGGSSSRSPTAAMQPWTR